MGFLTSITDFVGGSLFKEVREVVMAYLPPNMTPVEKAEYELKLQELLHKKELEANKILSDAAAQLDKRIRSIIS